MDSTALILCGGVCLTATVLCIAGGLFWFQNKGKPGNTYSLPIELAMDIKSLEPSTVGKKPDVAVSIIKAMRPNRKVVVFDMDDPAFVNKWVKWNFNTEGPPLTVVVLVSKGLVQGLSLGPWQKWSEPLD